MLLSKSYQNNFKNTINTKTLDHCVNVANHYYKRTKPQALKYLAFVPN